MTSQYKATTRRFQKFSKKMNSFAAEISILSFHFASREDLSLSWNVRSLPLVRVNLLAWQSARASNVSIVGPNSMISQPGWLAFFDLKHCSVRCGDEFGLEFN